MNGLQVSTTKSEGCECSGVAEDPPGVSLLPLDARHQPRGCAMLVPTSSVATLLHVWLQRGTKFCCLILCA